MGKAERESEAARAADEKALKEAKVDVEHCEEHKKEAASRKALLGAQEKAFAATEERKAAELACFPEIELRLRTTLRSLYQDEFDDPLATPEDDFVALVMGIVAALEIAVVQVDNILDTKCCDLFFAAATHVFSHLHLCDPGFDLSSMIVPVRAEACDRAAEVVKGPVEALVRRFARVAAPSSPSVAEADDGEDDASDVDDQPPAKGATSSGSS
ncbi:hypothetical protein ZWY2020_040741 [Hordeum vulgare]|nr:hypothetical protein ZWY2020_040741 [Hordeum vulgare]